MHPPTKQLPSSTLAAGLKLGAKPSVQPSTTKTLPSQSIPGMANTQLPSLPHALLL
jgi:hypothetical protein